MLSSSLALHNGSIDRTFNTVSFAADGVTRLDILSTPATKCNLVIRHGVQGKGQDAADRHNITFSQVMQSVDGMKNFVGTVSLSYVLPRLASDANSHMHLMTNQLLDLITGMASTPIEVPDFSVLDAILRGES